MNRLLLASVIALFITGCSNTKRVTLDPVVVTANSAGLDQYRATAPLVWNITNTKVALSFNLAEKTADGKAWISLHPYIYPVDTLQLDAKGMVIQEVMLEGAGRKNLAYDHKDDVLKIRMDRKYETKDTIQVFIRYIAKPYATAAGGSKAISEDRGLYFINTDHSIPGKPVQIWTQGETEATSHWMPTFDKPNERFTLEIALTVPDSFKTLSNGYLASQLRSAKDMRTDTWVMDKPVQPYVAMFAIGNYTVVEDRWKGREVSYYVEPEYAPYARLMFKNTPEMMDYFSTITGVSYPWNKYSQVVVRDYVSGAMENTTATVFGEFMNQNAREIADKDYEDIVSHELFHQWFGDYVTAESWSHLTVNESFANYGEQLWRRHKYGDASADELAFDDLWKYLSSARQSEPSLVRHKYSAREEMFDLISYQKGGAILNYLHNLMGDTAFFRAMKTYLTQNALKPAEATHWRLAVEEATGRDWTWFFNQWYFRGGFPDLDVQYQYDDAAGKLNVTVTQKQENLFDLPLKAELIYGNTKDVVDYRITGRKETFSYPYKGGQKPVFVPDAGYWLVGKVQDNKEPKYWLTQFSNSADNILSKRYAVGAVTKKLDDADAQRLFSLALTDKEAGIRKLVLQHLAQKTDTKWQDKWKADVALMATNDGAAKVRAAAFDVLAAWKVAGSKQDMLAALTDSSYDVAGAALRGLYKLKDEAAYPSAKKMMETDPRASLLFTALEIIGEEGKPADHVHYENYLWKVYGTDKIEFAHAYATYLEYVKDIATFEKALQLYVKLTNSESIGPYRYAIGSFFFETASEYKEASRDARTNSEKDDAKKRLELMKTYAEKIIAEEKSENYKRQYRAAMKKIFG